MGKKKNKGLGFFEESLLLNTRTYDMYLELLTNIGISCFKWNNLPESCDERYLELSLFQDGKAIFFMDNVIGYLSLSCVPLGNFNVYGLPVKRQAYSKYNNYRYTLKPNNSVLIYNNRLRTNAYPLIRECARKLYNIDRIMDVNLNNQKTPLLIKCSEKQKLSYLNLYKEYDGNTPIIMADETLDSDNIKVLNTQAPYLADKLFNLKFNVWNEALTYLGVANISYQKKERLISDEVERGQGGVFANRQSRLLARQNAADEINRMFGLNVSVEYIDNDSSKNGGEPIE